MSKNWQLQLPALADVSPLDPTRVRLPTGPYACRILDSEGVGNKDNPNAITSIKFTTEITEEGQYKGRQVFIRVGVDMSKKGNQGAWKALLMGVGAPPHLFSNPMALGGASFAGKGAFLYCEAAPEGEQGAYDNYNFIEPTVYQRLKQSAGASAGAAHTAAPTLGAPVPQLGGPIGATAPVGAPQLGGLPGVGGSVPQVQNGVAQLGATLGQPAPGAGLVPQPTAGAGGVQF